jgi:hypothetical protein
MGKGIRVRPSTGFHQEKRKKKKAEKRPAADRNKERGSP